MPILLNTNKIQLSLCLLFLCSIVSAGSVKNNSALNKYLDTATVTKPPYAEQIKAKRAKIKALFNEEDPNAIDAYTHGFLWGMGLKSNGWNMTFRWLRTVDLKNAYHIEADISEIVDPRETVTTPYYFVNGLIFQGTDMLDGKINILYPMHIGFGWNHYISHKATHFKKGAFLQLFGTAGLVFGIQKPYNIEVINLEDRSKSEIIAYSESTSNYYNFKDESGASVKGRTPNTFFEGWDKIEVKPGIFAKGGIRFGFSKRSGFISAINLGMAIDLFFSDPITIVLESPTSNLFYHVFIGFEIGRTKMKR